MAPSFNCPNSLYDFVFKDGNGVKGMVDYSGLKEVPDSLPPEKKAVFRKGVGPSPNIKYGTSFVPEKERALEWKDYISDEDALQFWPNECKYAFLYVLINFVTKYRTFDGFFVSVLVFMGLK
ncbi:hypothetical protein L6164_018158 [Bauhinia variegata]|uniref:Uncharacterized protein n=1 Tax=Bauhinia variegata TaxID=167791 RepID=A0ACB9NAW4_BAUVA|nr:hypothetical protein L6164_018158 [Bauhinia variegata]